MPTQEETAQNMEKEIVEEVKETNAIALFSYLGILLVIPLLVAKEDPFVKFHVKQGLVLLIAGLIVPVFAWIPIVGWLFGIVAVPVLLVFAIMGIVNVLQGREKELPLIGQYGDRFNF